MTQPPTPAPPKPTPPAPPATPEPKAPEKPPWGDDFDPERAWNLVTGLRGDKEKLKTQLEEAAADREELETLRNEKLSAGDKALKEAVEKAQEEAKSAVESQWKPKYQAAQLRGIASGVITDKDQLNSFLAITDPAKFVGDDGEIDEQKVMGHLTAIFVSKTPPPRQWGQHSGNQPPERAGAAGRAALEKRHGVKNSS
jgi:hypothetical protein